LLLPQSGAVLPSDFAGIFSRYFVIGFFLPVFFVLMLVAHLVELSSTPGAYSSASGATQVVIIGGTGLLGGLLLLGLNQFVIRTFAGYPLRDLTGLLARRLTDKEREQGRFLKALNVPTTCSLRKWLRLETEVTEERTEAAVRLNRYFPWQSNEVMPTRLGNAIRSFESYPFKTYGLDGPPNWPRVEALMNENEKEALAEALTTFSFWLNWALLAPPAALYVVIGGVLGHSHQSTLSAVTLIVVTVVAAGLVAWGAYRAAVGAAVQWGAPVRSAFDLHRLELYSQLGLKRPKAPGEERLIARSANRAASFGEEFVAAVRNNSET
jgi:hypothetical protein